MSWKSHVIALIVNHWAVGQEFTLQDVYQHADSLAGTYPQNKNLHAKIRQTLQLLRRDSFVETASRIGTYRRRT